MRIEGLIQRKHAWCIGLLCGLVLLLAGTVQADYVDSVVLIPDDDGAFNTFDSSSAGAAHWTCVNDSTGDANRCDTDTSAKVYTSAGLEQYRITQAPDTSNICDSMAIYGNFAEQRSGTSGEWELMYGWRYREEGSWYWCLHHGGTDTVIISSPTCTILRHSWTKNPYFSDSYDIPWYWYAGYWDDGSAPNAFQPAFNLNNVETGCFLTDCIFTMFDVWVVFYFTVEEAEAESQIFLIGALDEENYHNPRCGIPPVTWE